jgi:hypothetical protein
VSTPTVRCNPTNISRLFHIRAFRVTAFRRFFSKTHLFRSASCARNAFPDKEKPTRNIRIRDNPAVEKSQLSPSFHNLPAA